MSAKTDKKRDATDRLATALTNWQIHEVEMRKTIQISTTTFQPFTELALPERVVLGNTLLRKNYICGLELAKSQRLWVNNVSQNEAI